MKIKEATTNQISEEKRKRRRKISAASIVAAQHENKHGMKIERKRNL